MLFSSCSLASLSPNPAKTPGLGVDRSGPACCTPEASCPSSSPEQWLWGSASTLCSWAPRHFLPTHAARCGPPDTYSCNSQLLGAGAGWRHPPGSPSPRPSCPLLQWPKVQAPGTKHPLPVEGTPSNPPGSFSPPHSEKDMEKAWWS